MTVITSTTWKSGNKYLQIGRVPKVVIVIILFYLITITDSQQLHYDPVDNITIDCGSSGNLTTQEPRNWNGDIGSKYFPSGGQNNASVTLEAAQRPMVKDHVPYETARLSGSEFTYTIPVTPGPKFVRLYFFSATYENFDPLKAFFDVKVGQYTLLSNFSVSPTADAHGFGIEKEYIVPVEESFMNIMFIPSSSISGAFAFINGIEVVSMPPNLYYSEDAGRELKLVGYDDRSYTIPNHTALEKVYRINIGGKHLSPTEDNGMFREWEQESEYLTEAGFSVLPVNKSSKLNYKDNVSSYAAPDDVYKTGRSTGNGNKSEVRSYNLTWQFPVDFGFSYMLRLHFCEIIQEFTKTGDRVFLIYIANNQAERTFDIIGLSGGQYTPYFQDYMVLMFGSRADQKNVNLSVALQANPSNDLSHYIDAILNGLEIFKLNETNGNLAGPTTPRSRNVPPLTQPGKNNRMAIVGIVSGVVAGIVVLSVLGFFLLRPGRSVKESTPMEGTTWWRPISFTTNKSSKTRGSSSLPSDLCRYFSLAEIRAATNNFEDIFIIGVGGFGNVYKGYIEDGTTPVAIKRLKPESSQGANEFKTEIEMLSHLRHRHLVSLIGYCNDDREMILVYDYMARGTLCHHLYNTDNSPLSWKQRLEICLGAARGLQYLHTGAKHTIIHRDVKTTNILLDEKWVAKVSDFGLSKTGPTGISKAHVTTVVKGSVGYLDPEYYKRQQLTEKSDVYSFGVVLCEVLCARPPILRTAGKGKVSLAEWAPSCYRDGTLDQIIDPHLTGKIAPECLKKYGEIFVSCMLDNGTERPSMNDIVWGLEFAMQLQQSAEDNDGAGGAIITAKDENAIPFMNDNSDGTFTSSWEDTSVSKSSGMTNFSSSDKGSTTNESIKGMSGAVFSEINNNAKGR